MKSYTMPIRREFWEFHGAFVKAPLVIIVLILVTFVLSIMVGSQYVDWAKYNTPNNTEIFLNSGDTRHIEYTDTIVGEVEELSTDKAAHGKVNSDKIAANLPINLDVQRKGAAVVSHSPYLLMGLVSIFIWLSYSLACLYTDRKDNSILFWKSMPVSEWQTVMTKFLVANFVISGVAWLAAVILSLLIFMLIVVTAMLSGVDSAVALVFSRQQLLPSAWNYMGVAFAISLWSAPATAWLMFASAAAKRIPFLFALAPLLGVVVFEKIIFGSYYFGAWVARIFAGILPSADNAVISQPSWASVYSVVVSVEFWLGLLITAVLLGAATWCRERRYVLA